MRGRDNMITKMRIERLRMQLSLVRFGTQSDNSQSLLSLVERRELGIDRDRAERIAAALHEPLDQLFAEHDGRWWALREQQRR